MVTIIDYLLEIRLCFVEITAVFIWENGFNTNSF